MRPMNLMPTNTGELGMGGVANIHQQNIAQWAKFQVKRFFILDIHPKSNLTKVLLVDICETPIPDSPVLVEMGGT